jgi:hypothetical protein
MLRLACHKQTARANDFYLVGSLLIVALLVATTGHAATATSQDAIPAGTTITNANWKQFARFMPIGMQTLSLRETISGRCPRTCRWRSAPPSLYHCP